MARPVEACTNKYALQNRIFNTLTTVCWSTVVVNGPPVTAVLAKLHPPLGSAQCAACLCVLVLPERALMTELPASIPGRGLA